MDGILIRKACLADLPTLFEFEQGVITAERPFDPTLKSGQIHYYDIEKMIAAPDVELLVAEINNEVVGSGYARIENAKPFLQHNRHAYLGFMYIMPQWRGKGINKKILDKLTEWVQQHNITELRLDVYQPNIAAIKAYEKAGFTKHMIEMRKGL
ncbi:MAG: GNAT family N-acetyltransferase [Chitinophagaceae bacterium]|nr:GNAT family N-acetyltransferase [Chitinophagaceae bacterium]